MSELIIYCRPGLEGDCASELHHRFAGIGVGGYVKSENGSGYLRFVTENLSLKQFRRAELSFHEWVFPRQLIFKLAEFQDLSPDDRISPILSALNGSLSFAQLWQEYPDSNQGKSLSRLTKSLEKPLQSLMRKRHLLQPDAPLRLHLFWLSGTHVILGVSPVQNSAPWPMGYPRLKFPKSAPSRSTLKLEEAWLQLLTPEERATLLKPGLRATDLGAAPGGWTWQLVNKGFKVFAVDNGALDETLVASGQVVHLQEDAFTYKPTKQMDWLVCDIIDKPARVADLMARWLSQRWCKCAIFNLKLPMKKRWQTSFELLEKLRNRLQQADEQCLIRAKQLYHDRAEITVFVRFT